MSKRHAGVTFSQLSEKSNRAVIDGIVASTIKSIDATILTQHQNGFPSATYELPQTFGITNTEDKDVRFYVYSEILNQFLLEESSGGKGFTDVAIRRKNRKSILHVAWGTGMDEDEIQWRNDLLKSYTKEE